MPYDIFHETCAIMINKTHLRQFIEENDKQTLTDYRDKLYSNLQEISRKEEKHTLVLMILVVLFFFVDYKSLSEISLGIITIANAANLVVQLIPVIFCALLFNLYTIGRHRGELHDTLLELTSELSKTLVNTELKNELINNTLYKLYLPYSIANFASVARAKRHILISLFGFILMLPFVIIGFLPFIVMFLMLSNLWRTQMDTTLGIIAFWLTLWISLSIIFFFFIPQNEEY